MMDAMKVAAVLRRAAENAGCGLHDVVSGGGDCPEGTCNGCREVSAAWANEAADAIERCSLPAGVEWPRFEDGEIVRFGDKVSFGDEGGEVSSIELQDEGYFLLHVCNGAGRCSQRHFSPVERVKRPPVLAADGEPLEVGQTVWEVDGTGHPFKVVSIRPSTGRAMEPTVVTCDVGDGTSEHILPSQLTHQRPVLDADGVPIREGDTVYNKVTGEPGTAIVVDNDGQQFATVKSHDRGNWCDPICFTHTKPEPDSWSSVWADVSNGNETPEGMIRRCRALAERGER